MMSSPECINLDEYLLGWLPLEAAERFEAHLVDCPECRDEGRRQQTVDRQLAAVARHSQPVPGALAGRIERRIRSAAWKRRLRLGAGSSLAALLLIAGVWLAVETGNRGVNPPADPLAHREPVDTSEEAPLETLSPHEPSISPSASVKSTDPSRAIIVPVETDSPNVTLVWVYPTVQFPPPTNESADD